MVQPGVHPQHLPRRRIRRKAYRARGHVRGRKTTYVAAQGFTAEEFVKVEERTVIEGTDASSHGLQAVETSGTSGPFVTSGSVLARGGLADRSGLGTNEYIDPYDFDIAEFRTEAEKITAVTVEITGVGVVSSARAGSAVL